MSFFERMREDIRSVLERDPAARSKLEVLTCYPGLWAVWIFRISHALWNAKLRLAARRDAPLLWWAVLYFRSGGETPPEPAGGDAHATTRLFSLRSMPCSA